MIPSWLPWLDSDAVTDCGCEPVADGTRLIVAADSCRHDGALSSSPACRATVAEAIGDAAVDRIVVRSTGREAAYLDESATLLAAASRFARRVEPHDDRLASVARRDPLQAAADASTRADPVRSIATDSGLIGAASGAESYQRALRPAVGPTVSDARFVRSPPASARLRAQRSLSTGATVRVYDREAGIPLYHIEPIELQLESESRPSESGTANDTAPFAKLDRAADLLASGSVSGDGAGREAVHRVVDDAGLAENLGAVLEKHTADLGVLVDLFADPAVTDVFATPPIPSTPLRVTVDGETAETNVLLSERGARALASTFRLESGNAFSRANPLLDATATAGDREIRVAGTTSPVSDGLSFAIRAHEHEPWTLARLVDNGTLPADAAALLSIAVERDAAVLVAGPRGAGKTTLLGALLFELSRDVRTLLIEDTPELPTAALREDGRDVQTLHTDTGDGPGLPPASVLRGALRLGDGALAVGEVRGDEAGVLYEAMRVGASDSAVLGTIHGDGGESVRERVVSDLDVPESSFATTDLVVSLERFGVDRDHDRRLAAIEEVIEGDDGVRFAPLFDAETEGTAKCDRIGRGASRFVESITDTGETYADICDEIERRTHRFETAGPSNAHTGNVDAVIESC